ncbi:MAG TPA: hypothetical protein VHE30_16175 [Polyangiaceae bacterium]|nr:hypothetical protein [Polyangiaceae bacterium]
MSDEKPWLEQGGPEDVTALLAAARAEEPDPRSVGRTLAAVGVGAAAVTAATHATGATLGSAAIGSATKGAASAGSLLFVLKWGAVGAAVAVTTVVAGTVVVERVSPEAPPRPVPASAAAERAVVPRVAAPVAPVVEVREEPSPAAEPLPPIVPQTPKAPVPTEPEPAPPAVGSSERMLREVAAVDHARALLGRGDARGSLAALDSYARDFPERRFEPESLYIRMEAERALGDGAGARRTAEQLLASFPRAPQAARARVLLGR